MFSSSSVIHLSAANFSCFSIIQSRISLYYGAYVGRKDSETGTYLAQ